jgi:hypothetical protein
MFLGFWAFLESMLKRLLIYIEMIGLVDVKQKPL